MRYETRKNSCDCHPEICTHFDWYVFDTKLEENVGNGSDIFKVIEERADDFNRKESGHPPKEDEDTCGILYDNFDHD